MNFMPHLHFQKQIQLRRTGENYNFFFFQRNSIKNNFTHNKHVKTRMKYEHHTSHHYQQK